MANIGFSVGDIVTVGSLAWNVYQACSNASSEFREVSREVLGLHAAIKQLEVEAFQPDAAVCKAVGSKYEELEILVRNIEQTLVQLDKLVSKYKSLGTGKRRKRDVLRFSFEGLEGIRSSMTVHTSNANLFLGTLSVAGIGRMEIKLDEIVKELRNGQRDTTAIAVSDDEEDPTAKKRWRTLRKELVDDGFQQADIDSHKTWIKAEMRKRIEDNQDVREKCIADADLSKSPSVTGDGAQLSGQPTDSRVRITQPVFGCFDIDSLGPPFDEPHAAGNKSIPNETEQEQTYFYASLRANQRKAQQTGQLRMSQMGSTPGNIWGDSYSDPEHGPTLHRSSSVTSMNSVHSDVSDYDANGNLTKRTVTTTTTMYYGYSSDDTDSFSPRQSSYGSGMKSAALMARNSQAGPHKCTRINPSTNEPCNTIFARPYDLTRHEDTVHNNRKQKVRCSMCREEKTFSRNDALVRHMRVVHPEVESFGKPPRRGD